MNTKVLRFAAVAVALSIPSLGLAGCGAKPNASASTAALKPTPKGTPVVDLAAIRQMHDKRRLTPQQYARKYPGG